MSGHYGNEWTSIGKVTPINYPWREPFGRDWSFCLATLNFSLHGLSTRGFGGKGL